MPLFRLVWRKKNIIKIACLIHCNRCNLIQLSRSAIQRSIVKHNHTITCKMTTKQVNYDFKHMQIEYNLFAHFKCIQIQRNFCILVASGKSVFFSCFFFFVRFEPSCVSVVVGFYSAINHCFDFELRSSRCKSIVKWTLSSSHVIEYEFCALVLLALIDFNATIYGQFEVFICDVTRNILYKICTVCVLMWSKSVDFIAFSVKLFSHIENSLLVKIYWHLTL